MTEAASHPSESAEVRLRLGESSYPLDKEKLILGRSRSCDIRVKVDTISRLHAAFIWSGPELVLEDLGSTNGSFLNGQRLQEPCTVFPGDSVQFGSLRGEIEGPPGSARRRPTPEELGFDYTVGLLAGSPAGLGWRLVAAWLDVFLFALGSLVPFAPYLVMILAERYLLAPQALPPGHQVRALLAGGCVGLWVLYVWYYVIHGWARRGGTPGMRLAGLRLLDRHYRLPIGYPRALLRGVALLATVLTAGLGFLLAVFRKDRATLHDLLARTIVAHRPAHGSHA